MGGENTNDSQAEEYLCEPGREISRTYVPVGEGRPAAVGSTPVLGRTPAEIGDSTTCRTNSRRAEEGYINLRCDPASAAHVRLASEEPHSLPKTRRTNHYSHLKRNSWGHKSHFRRSRTQAVRRTTCFCCICQRDGTTRDSGRGTTHAVRGVCACAREKVGDVGGIGEDLGTNTGALTA